MVEGAQLYQRHSRLKGSLRGIAVAALFVLAACSSLGPDRVPSDNFNYNEAIARSAREQMLLNLVRMRYLEHPVFLKVGSVLTQYTYDGEVSVVGRRGFQSESDIISGGLSLGYTERPTVTYLPVSGREFSQQLMASIPTELIFAVGQAGWPTDLLLEIGLQRIGDVENMSFGPVPAPGEMILADQIDKDLGKLARFQRLIRELTELSDENAFEVSQGKDDDAETRFFVFDPRASGEIRQRIQALKQVLGLDPERDVFRITERYTQRQDDEISVQPRSLMAMMSFLSRGTEIPEVHQQEGRVIPVGTANEAGIFEPPPIPFRIRSQKEPPETAFTAVRYEGHWYYIDRADVRSKRVLLMVLLVLSLRAPEVEAAAPALTLPTGP